MEKKRFLAICIPVYNRQDTVVEAISSVLSQGDDQVDVIIQDDQSTDNSRDRIETAFGNRVILRKNIRNLGFVGNINECLKNASQYSWIGILHSDDRHEGQSLRVVKDAILQNPNAGIIFSATNDIDSRGKVTRAAKPEPGVYLSGDDALCRLGGVVPYSTTFYKSEAVLLAGGYNSEYKYCADEEYNARIMSKFDVVQVDTVIGSYRRHAGQTMVSSWSKDDFIAVYEAMKLKINTYYSPQKRKSERAIKIEVAETLFAHCSGLTAHGEMRVARKFRQHLWNVSPRSYTSPSRLLRTMLQCAPFGRLLCRKFSLNAGL